MVPEQHQKPTALPCHAREAAQVASAPAARSLPRQTRPGWATAHSSHPFTCCGGAWLWTTLLHWHFVILPYCALLGVLPGLGGTALLLQTGNPFSFV